MSQEPARNELQFALRTLLLGMTVAAIALAVGTPWVRTLQLEARWFVIRWVSIYLLLAGIGYFAVSAMRIHIQRHAGRRLLSGRGANPLWRRVVLGIGVLGQIGFLVFLLFAGVEHIKRLPATGAVAMPVAGSGEENWELNILYMAVAVVFAFGSLILFGLDVFRPHLCERGYVKGVTRIYGWHEFDRGSWKTGAPHTAILWGMGRPWEFKTTAHDREQAAELLDRLIGTSPPQPIPETPFAFLVHLWRQLSYWNH